MNLRMWNVGTHENTSLLFSLAPIWRFAIIFALIILLINHLVVYSHWLFLFMHEFERRYTITIIPICDGFQFGKFENMLVLLLGQNFD